MLHLHVSSIKRKTYVPTSALAASFFAPSNRRMAKLNLGRLLATPGVQRAAEESNDDLLQYVRRHASGDWGIVDREDWRSNDRALQDGTRLLSAYLLKDGHTKIWIVTEADRSATTVLLPDEY